MPEKSDRSDSHAPEQDRVELGLAEAFRAPARPGVGTRPAASVLQALQARAGSVLGLHLDSQGLDDAPVRVTDEVKQLRDPTGRYQLLGEIGRGGVGVVYKGRDQDLGRDVAMKVLRDDLANRPDVLARFVEEAQIGGQLQHPGIVPVYELGLQAGERPYFAMKLVKGETLAAHLARRDDPTTQRRRLLGIFEQVCQTIAYAHARRVVHRDLKPANVMIGAFGEVQVVDWGFAKVLPKDGSADQPESIARDSDKSVIETVRSAPGSGSHSVAGSMLGTPSYMPPEQALGDIGRVDQRSDVFALGAILCEILTGAPPYREADGDLVRQAAAAALDGAHQRLAKCGADDALVALCTECMSPARRARPESAAEVAERIGEYLTSVEERARQAEVRAAQARYRHRVTQLCATAALVILALGAGTWIWADQAAQQRRTAAHQRVAAAMSTASGARGRAQAAGLDLVLWDTALQSAQALASLAIDEDVDADTHREATALLTEVEGETAAAQTEVTRQQRDQAMLARLEDLRIPTEDSLSDPGYQARRQQALDEGYRDAFAAHLGRSLFDLSPDQVVAALGTSGIEVQVELACSIDHWALVRDGRSEEESPPDAAHTAKLRAIATRLDHADAWRSKLRALLPTAGDEREPLLALAASADLAGLPATACRNLVTALRRAGADDVAMTMLVRARETHPRDFDLCFQLAISQAFGAEPREEAGFQTFRIAHALRPEHREVLHRQGLLLSQLGRHRAAERVFRRLDALQSDNPHWRRHLADTIADQGRLEEALLIYRRTVELDPDSSIAHNQLGRALERLGQRAEAATQFEKAVRLDEKNADAWSNLGNYREHQGRIEDAIDCQRRALAINPADPRYLNNMGQALQAQEKWKEAKVCYERALQIEPNHFQSLSNLAAVLLREGKPGEAILRFRKALATAPDDADLHAGLASALDDVGQIDEAIRSYRTAIKLVPTHVRAHSDLGHLLLQRGDVEQAVKCFSAAIKADPNDATANYNLGVARLRQGKPQLAVACFEQAIRHDQEHLSSHVNLGTALIRLGRIKDAFAHCRATVQKFPRSAMARVHFSNVLMEQGDRKAAILQLREAETLDPALAEAHTNLCNALRLDDQLDQAIAHGRRAVALAPELAIGRGNLAVALVQAGQIEQAIEQYAELLELLPRSDWAWTNLGSAHLRLDRPDGTQQAIRCFRKAIDCNDRNTQAHVNLGVALQKIERVAEALTHYQTAIRIRPDLEPRFRQAIDDLEQRSAERPALLEVLGGTRVARSAAEWAKAIQVGYGLQRRADVVALTERTFLAAPGLIEGLGDQAWGVYTSACAAALLAADPEAKLTARERARLRGIARGWLAREVDTWTRWVDGGGEPAAEGLRRLRYAPTDPDLASVRGKAIEALPQGEHAPWQELWTRITRAGEAKRE